MKMKKKDLQVIDKTLFIYNHYKEINKYLSKWMNNEHYDIRNLLKCNSEYLIAFGEKSNGKSTASQMVLIICYWLFNAQSVLLNGYDEDFKKGFKSGKVAVLGRGITFSIHTTRNYTENQILKLAKNNKIKPLKAIKNEIKAIKEDIKNLNSADNTNYIFNQLKEFMELQGFSLTESNKKKILNRLKKIDWLGSQKLMATFNSKLEKKFYEIYKDGLSQENNDDLLQSIFNDINKASKDKITMYGRLIE